MVKLIHARSGGEMWVHESRVEEYKAAGHKPAAEAQAAPAQKPKRPRKTTQK